MSALSFFIVLSSQATMSAYMRKPSCRIMQGRGKAPVDASGCCCCCGTGTTDAIFRAADEREYTRGESSERFAWGEKVIAFLSRRPPNVRPIWPEGAHRDAELKLQPKPARRRRLLDFKFKTVGGNGETMEAGMHYRRPSLFARLLASSICARALLVNSRMH